MAEFSCTDINGLSVSQFVFNDDGTVSGIVSTGTTGTTTTDPNSNPTQTTYQEATNTQTRAAFTKTAGTTLSPISEECCNALNFIWESSSNTCYWTQTCDTAPDFKITLGAKGNEGAFFHVEDDETCQLEVKFQYLLQFDCDTLRGCIEESQVQAGETTDTNNELETINDEITQLNDTIETLNDQLNQTQAAWDGVVAETNNQIAQKEDELQRYDKNITSLDGAIKQSRTEEQTAAYEAEKQKQMSEQTAAQSELAELERTLKEQENNCANDITRIEGTIEKYQNTLNEKTREQEALTNEAALLEASPISEVPRCLSIFEELDVCVTLDKIIPREDPVEISGQTSYETSQTLETVYEGQLFKVDNIVEFFDGNCDTGLLVTGDSRCMDQLKQCIIHNLSGDCDVFSACTLNSDWQEYSFSINDFETLSGITNEYLKLGFLVKNCVCDFNILIDRIEINKRCTEVDGQNVYITKCPQFELERVCDNKKSWVAEEVKQEREFFLSQRETDYDINHHKLAINTKEVDLEISPATAIETDLWCYLRDNEGLFSCSTGTTSVSINTDIDFSGMLQTYAESCEDCTSSSATTTGLTTNLVTNGTFDTDLSGWTVTPFGTNWIWSAGTAQYNGVDEGGFLTQDILETGCTYQVNFDVIFSGVGDVQVPEMIIYVGDNQYDLSGTVVPGLNNISFTGIATGSTTFSIWAGDGGGNGLGYIVDNVEVLKYTAGTEFNNCLSACTIESIWGINVELECQNIYSNPSFFTGSTLSGAPTQEDYVLELSGIAQTLGLEITTGTTEVIFTSNVDCSGTTFINKSFKVDLCLDITTDCGTQKQFQDGSDFDFQDGTPYNFN